MSGGERLDPVRPVVSVVVATYNRAQLLPRLVGALAAQEDIGPFEVIVVEDASPDDTAEVLARLAADAPFPLVALRQPSNRGPAAARNRGWREARSQLICFTDDDCVPGSRWLASMVAALGTADLAQGCTVPNPEQLANWGPFSHTLDVRSETGNYETANMGYRRAVLERLGGFDEGFRFPYGEDIDLAWRAKESGSVSCFVEQAVVYHDITPSSWCSVLRERLRHEGLANVLSRHPSRRGGLVLGVFVDRRHAEALCVTAASMALAVSPRSPRRWASAAATGLWYAWECRKSRMGPSNSLGWVGVIPGALVVDLVTVGVLARASARYRTLVL